MLPYSKVIAGIAGGLDDRNLASYLDFLSPRLPIEEICNFHVFVTKSMYDKLNAHSPGQGDDLLKLLEKKIDLQLKDTYQNVKKVQTKIVVGSPLRKLLQQRKEWKANLIALGKPRKGTSTLAKNVIRHIACDTLIIPVEAPLKLSHILVPVDMSEHSGKILRAALDIQKKTREDLKITCFHAFVLPNLSYYKTLRTQAQFDHYVRAQVKEAFEKFIDKYAGKDKAGIDTLLAEEAVDRPGRYILEYINKTDVDFVIMGTKSHSGFDAFLGSTVERVITKNDKIPLLVIK